MPSKFNLAGGGLKKKAKVLVAVYYKISDFLLNISSNVNWPENSN